MSQWTTLWSGPLAGLESLEKGGIVEKAVSQWTTFSSGPLAGAGSLEKGQKPGPLARKKAF